MMEKVYVSRKNAPLKWHYFTAYFGFPVGIFWAIKSILDLLTGYGLYAKTSLEWYYWLSLLFDVAIGIFLVVTFIALVFWKKLGMYGAIIACYIGIISNLLDYIVIRSRFAEYGLGVPLRGQKLITESIVILAFAMLNHIYYIHRENLFEKDYVDPYDEGQVVSIETEDEGGADEYK